MTIAHRTRPAGAPAYYLGRPAATWRTALRRRPHQLRPPGLSRPTTADHDHDLASRTGST
jgi:hypothetical protein